MPVPPRGIRAVEPPTPPPEAERSAAAIGDEIEIVSPGHSPGAPDRRGEILSVFGDPGRGCHVVAWQDGRTSVVPAGVGRIVVPAAGRGVSTGGTTYVLGSSANQTNVELVERWREHGLRAALLAPPEAAAPLPPGAVILGRLDVLPTLDGVEAGLLTLLRLERQGAHVLNGANALVAIHDKLLTARRLREAGLPHPQARLWRGIGPPPIRPPLVFKPRFGSWGRDVRLCRDQAELEQAVEWARDLPWFRRHGALLQQLVPPTGWDLRLIVAAGDVVGAGKRLARSGEWRTNVSLGGSLQPAEPPAEARSLARAAAAALGADLVGVDLLPLANGGFTVLELNGAVEFDARYASPGRDIYGDVARLLELPGAAAVKGAERDEYAENADDVQRRPGCPGPRGG